MIADGLFDDAFPKGEITMLITVKTFVSSQIGRLQKSHTKLHAIQRNETEANMFRRVI